MYKIVKIEYLYLGFSETLQRSLLNLFTSVYDNNSALLFELLRKDLQI